MKRYLSVALIMLLLTGCVVSTEESKVETSTSIAEESNEKTIESSFIGEVTGYETFPEGYGWYDQTIIYVSNEKIKLDLIWPYSAGCMEREVMQDKAFKSARDALEKVLPIGTNVLVIKSNFENGEWVGDSMDAFVHKIDGELKIPKLTPPLDSVNEQLVLTGYWVPLEKGFESPAYSFTATYGEFNPEYLSEIQKQYAPLILSAGNKARFEQVGATPICLTMALNYAIDAFYGGISFSRGDEEENRLWWIKRNKSRSCRDGDGDGVCYER